MFSIFSFFMKLQTWTLVLMEKYWDTRNHPFLPFLTSLVCLWHTGDNQLEFHFFVTLSCCFLALCHRQLHQICRHRRRGRPRARCSVPPTTTTLMKAERSGQQRAGFRPSAGLSVSPPSPAPASPPPSPHGRALLLSSVGVLML